MLSRLAQAIRENLALEPSSSKTTANSSKAPQNETQSAATNPATSIAALDRLAPEEYDKVRRRLLILLDQAVLAKTKISRAFPKRMREFPSDAADRFGLKWHPGWKDPERYIPLTDCDPYRGACGVSSCLCDLFELEGPPYVYHPDAASADQIYCARCKHPKSEHTLATNADRRKLKEFAAEQLETYAVPVVLEAKSGDAEEDDAAELANVRKEHPVDVPTYVLREYYVRHPEAPGAGERVRTMSLEQDATDAADARKKRKGKRGQQAAMPSFDDEDDPFS